MYLSYMNSLCKASFRCTLPPPLFLQAKGHNMMNTCLKYLPQNSKASQSSAYQQPPPAHTTQPQQQATDTNDTH